MYSEYPLVVLLFLTSSLVNVQSQFVNRVRLALPEPPNEKSCAETLSKVYNCSHDVSRMIVKPMEDLHRFVGFDQLQYRKKIQNCYTEFCTEVNVKWNSEVIFQSDILQKLYGTVLATGAMQQNMTLHPIDWAEQVFHGTLDCAYNELERMLPEIRRCIRNATPELDYLAFGPIERLQFEIAGLQEYMFDAFWQFVDSRVATSTLFDMCPKHPCEESPCAKNRMELVTCLGAVNKEQTQQMYSTTTVNQWTAAKINQCLGVGGCQKTTLVYHVIKFADGKAECALEYAPSNVGLLHSCAIQVLDEQWADENVQEGVFNCMFERTPLERIANHSMSFFEWLNRGSMNKTVHETLEELFHNYHKTYKNLDDTLPLAFMHFVIDRWTRNVEFIHNPFHCSQYADDEEYALHDHEEHVVADVLNAAFAFDP